MWLSVRRVLFICGCLCIAAPATAQNPRGSLVGIVRDQNGGRVPGAVVVVHEVEGVVERQATSDNRGQFSADDLLPGAYQVRVNASGFAAALSVVSIVVGSTREITVTMSPAKAPNP